MEETPTPGIWQATDGKVWRATSDGVEIIAICEGNIEGAPAANARLMAAAPELAEALEDCEKHVAALTRLGPGDISIDAARAAAAKARAAIAKTKRGASQ